jgi:hypothetical protein
MLDADVLLPASASALFRTVGLILPLHFFEFAARFLKRNIDG